MLIWCLLSVAVAAVQGEEASGGFNPQPVQPWGVNPFNMGGFGPGSSGGFDGAEGSDFGGGLGGPFFGPSTMPGFSPGEFESNLLEVFQFPSVKAMGCDPMTWAKTSCTTT